jgi:hypothetical protein
MKTSTLLLLFTTVSVFFCLSSFVISINSKYANGVYTYLNNDKLKIQNFRFPSSGVVAIAGIENCVVVSSDSLKLEISRDDVKNLDVTSSHDTITIVAREKSTEKVLLYLPSDTQLLALRSKITMTGAFDYLNPPSYSVVLDNSKLVASTREIHAFIHQLRVLGKGESGIAVSKRFHIQSLDLVNTTSATIAEGWQIGSLKTSFGDGMTSELVKAGDSVSIVASMKEPL